MKRGVRRTAVGVWDGDRGLGGSERGVVGAVLSYLRLVTARQPRLSPKQLHPDAATATDVRPHRAMASAAAACPLTSASRAASALW